MPPHLPLLRALPLAALLLAACGAERGTGTAACAPAPADTAGWARVAAAGVSLRLPPGYRVDPAAVADAGAETAASWRLPRASGGEAAARLTVQRGGELPELGETGAERAGLHEFRECVLPGSGARVATAWLDDPTSPTGRAWQTLARWPARGDAPALGVLLVADGEGEHRRLLAVLPSLRPARSRGAQLAPPPAVHIRTRRP